ncbi:MAG: hypothetical protein ACUVV5_06540 [Candidatus Aminicenantales bacterium]
MAADFLFLQPETISRIPAKGQIPLGSQAENPIALDPLKLFGRGRPDSENLADYLVHLDERFGRFLALDDAIGNKKPWGVRAKTDFSVPESRRGYLRIWRRPLGLMSASCGLPP